VNPINSTVLDAIKISAYFLHNDKLLKISTFLYDLAKFIIWKKKKGNDVYFKAAYYSVRFEVFTEITVKDVVFWDVNIPEDAILHIILFETL
jgi:hypothetical protein